jgi:hypothetical protein
LVRSNYVHDICNDFDRNGHAVFYNTVDNIDPGATGEHADFYQTFGGVNGGNDNSIIYGNTATNLRYQGFFVALDAGPDSIAQEAHGIALVANSLSGQSATDPTRAWSAWYRFTDNLLMWNNDFADQSFNFWPDTGTPATITNFSVKGNVFNKLIMFEDNKDFSLWDSNRFIIPAWITYDFQTKNPHNRTGTIGTNATTGEP